MAENLERKVADLEGRYRLVADNLVDAIWVLDLESHKVDFITPSVEKLSGFAPEEYVAVAMEERMMPESYQRFLGVLAEEVALYQSGRHHKRTIELQMLHKDGKAYWIEVTGRIFQGKDGRIKVAGVSKDINRRKEVEAEREQLVEQLNKALAEKERLLRELKIMEGLLPICAACRRIRDKDNRWWPLDAYVQAHSELSLTHTICPDCRQVMYEKPSQLGQS